MKRRRGGAVVLTGIAVALILCACTAGPTTVTASPTVDWHARLQSFLHKYGNSPAPSAPYTEDEARAASAKNADREWAEVLASNPTAVRPGVSIVHWASSSDRDLMACMLATGATPDNGVDSEGNVSIGYSYSGSDQEGYLVDSFACDVQFPPRPEPPANDAQVSYYFDYLTKFVVPCYEAHGAHVDAAPTREEFIAQHQPGQTGARWFPQPPNAGDAPDPTFDGKNALCPLAGPGGAGD